MKYVITGSIGHISKPIVTNLIKAGHDVTVITSNAQRSSDIEALGAKAAVGSIDDVAFLKNTFANANVVYTMVPPKFDAADWKGYIASVGKNYAEAIKGSTVTHIVNLSSIGAHLPDGCGPVSGLHHAENALNSLQNVHIVHLRPAYFYYNFFGNIGLIKNMGIIGSNFGINEKIFSIADTSDIAAVATDLLLNLNFAGHSVQYIASDEVSTDEIANVLGAAIGKADLQWISFTNEQALMGMQQMGIPAEVAKNFVEMGAAIQNGSMSEDYLKNRPEQLGKVKLADFAKAFAAAYNAN